MASISIPDSVTTIELGAFANCTSLSCVTIGNGLTNIGQSAFKGCSSLTNLVLPGSLIRIGGDAFWGCDLLRAVYFEGSAPRHDPSPFDSATISTVFYLPGTIGWKSMFAGRPTALWLPRIVAADPGFGIQTNHFGFKLAWASGRAVVIDACADLASPNWIPVQTNVLTDGGYYFSDPMCTNYAGRFYRVRSQ